MSRPLQSIGYQASAYERPTEGFHCGRLAEGRPCVFGPSSKGACGWVCTPHVREGGAVECGRPVGHHCTDGPGRDGRGRPVCGQVPCQPRPTLRRLRGLASVAAVVITIGVLALLISLPQTRQQLASPGPLTAKHTALACADCHAAAGSGAASWTSSALRQEHLTDQVDSAKCAACHALDQHGWRHAHGLPVKELGALQLQAQERWKGRERPSPGLILSGSRALARSYGSHDAEGFKADGKLDCASCHKEHRGRHAEIQVVPEHRCHVCHTAAFTSFEDGHPAFTTFGKRALPGNSIFTHWRHYELRFKKGAELACTECHTADGDGRHMVLKPRVFEQVCTRCHQHRGNLAPLPLVHLPPGAALKWVDDVERRIDDPSIVQQQGFDAPKATPLLELLLPDVDHAKGIKAWKQLRKRYKSLIVQAADDTDEDGRFGTGDWGTGKKKIRRKDMKKLRQAKKKYAKTAKAWLDAVGKLIETLGKGDLEPVRRALGLGPDVDLSALKSALPVDAFQAFRAGMIGATTGDIFRQPANLGRPWLGFGEWRWRSGPAGQSLGYEEYAHVEPFLKALVDLLPKVKADHPAGPKIRKLVAARCGKCHVNPELPLDRQVQWVAIPSPGTRRRLTHFAHDPHLNVSPDCRGCHVLPEEEPDRHASDFVIPEDWRTRGKVGEAGCLKCHTEQQYGAACSLCHDYHAGERAPGTGQLPLRLKAPK